MLGFFTIGGDGGHAALIAGLGYAAAIAGEAVADDFGQYRGSATDGMVVVFQQQGGSTAAGYQAVAVLVEGTACPGGLVHTDGEGSEGIEGGHGVVVGFLGATA